MMNTFRSKNRSKRLLASLTTAIGVMLVLVGMPHNATAQDAPTGGTAGRRLVEHPPGSELPVGIRV